MHSGRSFPECPRRNGDGLREGSGDDQTRHQDGPVFYCVCRYAGRSPADGRSGSDAIISHVGTTVGGSVGVVGAAVAVEEAINITQSIIDAGKEVNPDIFFLAHGGPINTPADVRLLLDRTEAQGFVGASSLERMGVEQSLTNLTKEFKALRLKPKTD